MWPTRAGGIAALAGAVTNLLALVVFVSCCCPRGWTTRRLNPARWWLSS